MWSRVGNGSGRERESRMYFVADRNVPTPSRTWSLFLPTAYRPGLRHTATPTAYCSRHECLPSCRPPSCPHPSPRRSHTTSPTPRNSLIKYGRRSPSHSQWWMGFPSHLPWWMGCISFPLYDYMPTDATLWGSVPIWISVQLRMQQQLQQHYY